jgi:sugar-specific transcriptional regulator TrmB
MELISALEQIGLTKQESEVFIATTKLGVAKASSIAKKCDFGRSAVYYTLSLLKEKGFISEIIQSGVQHYSAATPTRIIEILDEEKEKQKATITDVLDELKEIRTSAIESPKIEFFEGYEGFKTVVSRLLEYDHKDYCCYVSAQILDYLPHFHEQFRKKRAAKGIRIRSISQRNTNIESIKKRDKEELRETRYNEKILKDTNILQYILDDSVMIIRANKKEQSAIHIQNEEFATLQKNIFEEMWKKSEKK